MVEKYVNESIESLYSLLPSGWEKVVLYAEIDKMHYNIFFYVKHNGTYYQCYSLDKLCDTSEDEVDEFSEKWYEIALEYKKKEEWKAYTLSVDKSGNFEIEYSYDVDFNLDDWKSRFLL